MSSISKCRRIHIMSAGRVSTGLSLKMIGTIALMTMVTLSFIGPSLLNTGYEDQRVENQLSDDMTLEYTPPADEPVDIGSGIGGPAPTGWVGGTGDFIISYDETTENHAINPSVAENPITGNIHAVWHEVDETTGNYEIHHSATVEKDPFKWTGETDDRIISDVKPPGKAGYDYAFNASICIDELGIIHVVWSQQYIQDGTWEVHYSRSDNDGKDWTSDSAPDIVVSQRERGIEATTPPDPKIAVGRPPGGGGPPALYVAWTENYQYEKQEVHFSRSLDGGDTWTGSDPKVGDQVLSIAQFANNPCIAATGDDGKIVNVVWEQYEKDDPGLSKEIYFNRSTDFGTEGSWMPEAVLISDPQSHPKPMVIGNVEMVNGIDDLHVVWDQVERGGGGKADPPLSGIFYSFSDGSEWRTREAQVDRTDFNVPSTPSIGVVLGGKAPVTVQVTWSELVDEVEFPSMEIHTSITNYPLDPLSWSGLEKDQVLSWPDNHRDYNTDATNPSMIMWKNGPTTGYPVIIWDELNVSPGKVGLGRGQPNTEIHFLPPPVEYTITATSGSYGSINPSGSVKVTEGDSQTFNFYPNTGYHVSDVVVDSSSVGTPSSYQFTNVNSDHTIHVTFSINYYTLSTTISPSGKGTVSKNPNLPSYSHGTVVTLTANPIVGWHFTSWSGSMSGSSNPDTITMNSNKAVTANFAINTYTITATAGTGGSIAPSGAVSVNYGADQAFVISANAGYAIKDVLVDSVSQGAISGYTFVFVTSAHTIEAQFIPKYTKSLVAGWNRISFPLEQANTSIETVLDSIDAFWDDARYFDGSTQTWKTYTNGVGGTLTDVDHKMGIWVHITGSCTLTVTGVRPSSTVISLKTGWNMVGYPAEVDSTYDVADLKADVSAVQLVYFEDWRYQMTELGDSYVLQNGELYWIFVSSDTTWTVDW
jgi:hypothetical protein